MSAKLNRCSALCASFHRVATGLSAPNNRSDMNARIGQIGQIGKPARNVKTGQIVRRVPNAHRVPNGRHCRNALRNVLSVPNNLNAWSAQNLQNSMNR